MTTTAPLLALTTLACMFAAASATCANACSGHGTCNIYSSCDCYRNFMGADCSQRVCYFGIAFVDTPQGDLNADGYVSDNQYNTRFTNEETWEVYPWFAGYGGYNFDMNGGTVTESGEPNGEGHFYKECSSKGVCDRATGTCVCFPGFAGEGCTRTACPDDCSGHGLCRRIGDLEQQYAGWDATSTQQCVCDSGYFGANCALRECPAGDDPVTKYEGYTRITFQEAVATDSADYSHFDKVMCDVDGIDNAATPSYPAFGPENNRVWDYRTITHPIYAKGWQWNAWYTSSPYQYNVYVMEGGDAKVWPVGAKLTEDGGDVNNAIVLGGYEPINDAAAVATALPLGHVTAKATKFVVVALTKGAIADLTAATDCYVPVGRLPDAYPDALPGFEDTEDAACTGVTFTAAKPIREANDYLCGDGTTATTHQLCTDDMVSYHMSVPRDITDPGSIAPVYAYSELLVTGSSSQATGVATGGCCTDSENKQFCEHEADSQCDFWSLYLKDTEGTFQYGDKIEVSSSAAGAVATAHAVPFKFSLCNYISSIDTFYATPSSATADTDQKNEMQRLTLRMAPAITDTYEVRSLQAWLARLSPSELATATDGSPTLTFAGCSTEATATIGVDASNYLDLTDTAMTKFGVCTETEALAMALTVNDGTTTWVTSGVAIDPDISIESMLAEGLVTRSRGEITGSFQGYFALEFTDETGDTWMTESIAVNSTAVASGDYDAGTDSYTYVGWDSTDTGEWKDGGSAFTSGVVEALSTQTEMQAAGAPPDADHVYELNANPDEFTADFFATAAWPSKGNGGYYQSDKRSGQLVADRIEAALEALPNNVLGDVEVYYEYDPPNYDEGALAGELAKAYTKTFSISFVSNSGDLPEMRVAYSFVDATMSAAGPIGYTYQNSGCGTTGTVTGSDIGTHVASDADGHATANDGCGAGQFGEVTLLTTSQQVGASITTVSDGTTENAECSNRGLCDYAAGECKCFAGFTEADCSKQNALSMF